MPAQDPIAFTCTAFGVLGLSVFALWVPTRAAKRLDPVQILKAD